MLTSDEMAFSFKKKVSDAIAVLYRYNFFGKSK